MTRTFTLRLAVCVVATAVGIVFGISGFPAFLVISLPFFWALVLSFLDQWWPHPDDLNVGIANRRAVEGDEVQVDLILATACSLPWIEAELELADGLGSTAETRRVEHHRLARDGHRFLLPLNFRAAAWGVNGPRAVRVATQDRFGMTRCEVRLDCPARVVIHPQAAHLDRLLTLTKTRHMTGEHRSKQRGQGTELAEVRPARPGDLAASIHPGLTARRGTPMVLERHPEQASDVVLLVDATHDIGVDLDSTLRWTVQAALAINQRHQRGMDRVGIIDWGGTIRWLDPGLGRRSSHRIVHTLLETSVIRRSDAAHAPVALPLGRLPRRCVVLAISPGLSTTLNRDLIRIRRRGHQVIVVQPLLAEHLGHELPARIGRVLTEARSRSLTSAGILVVRWNPTEPLGRVLAVIDRRRGRTPEGSVR